MKVIFDGDELAATAGERLLDVARRNGLALEGTCNGDLACATCHVIVDAEWFAKLPAAREEEEDMLDLVNDARRTSRLACQIVLTPEFDKLSVSLP
ncbi:2Fe-2S iron-sulfur cluster-binding protein [Sphingomonas sp. 8AM]|uniref:2Fe-2S iron-sulfur cluster-binding protein n=1 Tax=Sphingomonas sp. 8AM TaxID=2653170 RepID=UPI0012EF293B|nr:2Fe-2S iron-sulfur cluster-binding protein [Sphingomonas sp. 8AM]VXC79234.1 (2Fe-2S) ferredoxin [Sphingomonas sp. 8AM]